MKLDSDAQAVIEQYGKFNAPPIESLSPENARNNPTLKNAVEQMAAESAMVRTMNVAMPALPEPVGSITHQLIPSSNGELLARIFRPRGDGPFPIIVYFHGGGWVIANLDVYEPSCRALCNEAEAIVVSVAYRQAPEHKYPAAVEDAHAALQWVIQNAASVFAGDPNRVVVAGESAGGNLATVACLKARDEGGQLPAAQLLIYPVTDARMNTPSYDEQRDAKPLNAAMMPWFWKHYLERESQGLEPYASPLLAESLRGLPPAIVITADNDPLRDEGDSYARRLAEAGVPVESRCFYGAMHEFFGLAGAVSKAADALRFAAEGLERVFDTHSQWREVRSSIR